MTSLLLVSALIFDTDSGFFADDGAALTLLMRSPLAPPVKGITVVSGNVWASKGVEYMERNLRLLGRTDVKVHLGAQEPLVHTAAMVKAEGAIDFKGALGETADVSTAPATAVDFIINTIQAQAGKVTFMALGPMTNLAIALRLRPDLAAKIQTLIFMGGAVAVPGNTTNAAEFNFWYDPEAAQAVLRSAIPEKIMFGLDITNHAPIRIEQFRELISVKTPITDLINEDMGYQFPAFHKKPGAVTYMWDALVSAYLIDPAIVTKESTQYLDVDVRFGPNYGRVLPLERSLAPHATPVRVMLDVDFPKAWSIYKKAMTQE